MTTINSKTVNNLINSLEEALESVQTEIENLEETYRKMLEEAKSSLDAQKEEMETQLAYWKVVRDNDGVVKKRKRRTRALEETPVATEQPEDEKVVDEEAVTEEPVNDALPFDDPENPEATEATGTVPEDMPAEIAETPQETEGAESCEGWGDEKSDAPVEDGDDEWANFNKEW